MGILHQFGWISDLLVIAGILSFLTIITGLFFSLGRRTGKMWATELPEAGSEDFLKALARLTDSTLEKGSEVKILNNGREFLGRLLESFASAEHSINFTAYIWEDGKMSDAIIKTLLAKAKQGVEIRIILDGFGALFAPGKKFRELEKYGAVVEKFRTPRFGRLTRLHRRNHRRAIIVDGKIGFTGGMAVGDKWYGGEKNEPEWRDLMFELKGAMAQSLQADFAALWAGTKGEILIGEKFYPKIKDEVKTCGYIHVSSSPAADSQPLPKFFWLSISCAKERIYLTSPYVVPDKHVTRALINRAKEGVDVRILVPDSHTDAKPIRLAGHSYFSGFLKAGIKIYEYKAAMIHSKVLTIDGKWSIIGSANMDIRSKELNEENVVGILSPQFAEELEAVFIEDLKSAEQITLEKWKKRTFFTKLFEKLCATFIEQY